MAENSHIEWTHHTYNPYMGCQKVGPGCDHCYAEAMMDTRLGTVNWGPDGARVRTSLTNRTKPILWNKKAMAAGERHRVFCASLADVFDNHASILPEWRADLWQMIRQTTHLDWQLLTKRPGNIPKMLPPDWGDGYPNVWLGCTVVNQAEADRDIPKLLAVPAAVRFLSMEPLLGPVDIGAPVRAALFSGKIAPIGDGAQPLSWVIVGGKSGPGARPMHPDWARSLRDQCVAAGVPFFFKQWGEWGPRFIPGATETDQPDKTTARASWHDACGLITDSLGHPDDLAFFCEGQVYRVGKARAGRLLDGREWSQFPGVRP